MTEALLEVRGLRKSFGGITATDGVDLDVRRREVHAVIGPNGAGKTTLIAQLTGSLRPDSGRIRFKNRDITRLPPYRRSRMGLARSFQITSIVHEMTVLENVVLAVQAHDGHSYRFWRPALADPALREPALQALARVGLERRAGHNAGRMSHGEHRQLEIAMAIATEPELLLLDEPMAGMGPEESTRMIGILRDLTSTQTILLVEHDMDVVFALADRISVLVYGRVIASGDPESIRKDANVRSAYLGDSVSDDAA